MTLTASPRTALPGPFHTRPSPDGIQFTHAVEQLVVPQVQALLRSSPAYYQVDEATRADMERNLTKIAAYSAALIHDGFSQAEKLGQTPVLRHQIGVPPPAGEEPTSSAFAARPPVRPPGARRPGTYPGGRVGIRAARGRPGRLHHLGDLERHRLPQLRQ